MSNKSDDVNHSNLTAQNLSPDQLTLLKKSFTKSIVKVVDMTAELQSEAVDVIISQVDDKKGK